MSSINQFPTFKYSQPDEYHFSHDSVFLARKIFEIHKADLNTDIKILDLCAGCGIVGLDLLFHQLKEQNFFQGEIDFLEVQEIYRKHFANNFENLKSHFSKTDLKINWLQKNYADENVKKYDLIISNPPYFILGQGALSPNEFKNRCRFFMDSDWPTMLNFMRNSLKPKGRSYFLVREDLKALIQKQNEPNISFPFQIRSAWVGLLQL